MQQRCIAAPQVRVGSFWCYALTKQSSNTVSIRKVCIMFSHVCSFKTCSGKVCNAQKLMLIEYITIASSCTNPRILRFKTLTSTFRSVHRHAR